MGIIIGAIGVLIIFFFGFLASIVKRIPFPERWIVDRRGELIEKGPGYCLIIHFFGYEKVYQKVKTGVDYPISLFPKREEEKKEVWIDLAKGGEMRLEDPKVWISVEDPLEAAKHSLRFEDQIREMTETRLTGTLNRLSHEEVLAMRAPKVMQKEEEKKAIIKKIDEIIKESKNLQDFLKIIKARYVGFTLDDFDFDPVTSKKRTERILAEMEKEIAQNRAQARKNEMLAIAETTKELKKAGISPERAERIASERYQDHLAAEKGKLQKIIWSGGGTIAEMSALWEMGKKMLGDIGPERKPSKESKKSEELTYEEKSKRGLKELGIDMM